VHARWLDFSLGLRSNGDAERVIQGWVQADPNPNPNPSPNPNPNPNPNQEPPIDTTVVVSKELMALLLGLMARKPTQVSKPVVVR
jgi:hypothetical protein